ncbi:MAG: 4-hydroxy-3-methylbut-2-enyl diphosphate reductase [Dehalococcoides mccartyi]|uniref:4-hydroxy-3-methylbut-2-enyl diphosphate reductase n=1 Tax=Dehalococcoides TaxID=61434 RepID=UPI00098F6A3D|nr:4-hydroxy-3-methylbut-2-enyl diphosphate reductase [Dehalococcoides mccartyi]AQU03570.1 4-hydroxy-3-methylbut-2-enyl diphosphate reductase [Dehalococcoides mccartyi]AQU04870.1 4-hydroxy-3-methylbut-2-enyl diphosphate reductase [Dehalococcoides mccartyi]MBF4481969.1 4-hydroxy-3-methylbut-2-enyl diphosphate reductase [Dehalococcoides mccartyi]MBJ7531325.1 4-hydroxy-3-methylbut-2-enyl diphosphate reductase [Dehalococcoides mccartyi]MDN4186543.1 4-hydroxy-3-methylbut-2-enyl diphosphate reductas
MKVECASNIGFCFGVRRAINILEKTAAEKGGVETLGALVHNQQVLNRLSGMGVRVVKNIEDISGRTVAISSHGVGPLVLDELKSKGLEVVDTTCPFVKRAQVAAKRFHDAGFFTVIYGDVNHPEVKGIMGWAGGDGLATLNPQGLVDVPDVSRYIGVLSQTTQIPTGFTSFVKNVIDQALVKDAEIRIADTLCHDIRERQTAALELAGRVDLMLVIGGHNSANTRHLLDLCKTVSNTYLIETASELQTGWLKGVNRIGITSGASTDETTISEVCSYLGSLSAGT